MSEAERRPGAEAEGDPRPWADPGAVRRDVAPHRAELLRGLANVSLACGIAAVVLGVPAVFGVPLAAVTRALADRDLTRMGGGRLDPRGRAATYAAFARAETALLLSLVAPSVCLLLWCGGLAALSRFL